MGDWKSLPTESIRNQIIKLKPDLIHRISLMRKRILTEWFISTGMSKSESKKLAFIGFNEFYKQRQKVKVFTGVSETLSTLSEQFTLAAITNGNADILTMPIGQYFSFAFRAEEFSAPKPHAPIFLSAIERLDVSPQDILHVGDDLWDDIKGASERGIRTAWVSKEKRYRGDGIMPDLIVGSVNELPKYLIQFD